MLTRQQYSRYNDAMIVFLNSKGLLMFPRNRTSLSILFFSMFLSANAFASRGGDVTEMSLLIQNNDIFLKYPGSVDRTTISSVQVSWWQSFSESIDARISIASLELQQKSNSSVLAYNATGYALGIGFRGNIFESDFVNAALNLGFDYLTTSGETNLNQAIEVSWYESSIGVDFKFLPLNSVSFLLGARYTSINGEHDVMDTSTVVSFSEDNPQGYYAGLEFKAGQGGKVTVSWQGGFRQGVYLSFSNRF